MEIRMAVPSDASAVAAVLHLAFVEFVAAYTPEAFAATTPTADRVWDRFAEGPIWVAVEVGAIVGTISGVPQGETLYLRSMATIPAARGRGVGRRLLECAEHFARESGYTRLRLSTTTFLTDAIALYERAGFSRSPEGPLELFGTPLVTMAKPIKREHPPA
jgi:GNAT superfamily N-acetyltransferase